MKQNIAHAGNFTFKLTQLLFLPEETRENLNQPPGEIMAFGTGKLFRITFNRGKLKVTGCFGRE